MALSYYSCILLYVLHLFIACQAQYELSIAPQNPVVLLGASVQLNCSISCPGGSTTWKGLDTNLGGLYIGTGFSILNIQNASISMDGTMICVGICPKGDKKNYQNSVSLHVYALPESLILSAHPEAEPPSLHCFMRAVYVKSDITVKWFKGLESLEASKQKEEWDEDEDGLSYYTWILPFAGDTEWEPRTSYGCEAEIAVGGHLFTRKGILHLPLKDTVGLHLATSLNVGIQATSAASSTITYTIPEEYPEILHEVSSPAQEYKSRLPMDTGTQTFPKSPLESPKQLITATIPSSSLPGSSNSFRRFPTAMPTAFQKVFQTSSSRKKHTNLLTEYPTVRTNVNVRSYSKPFISAFQGTQSASVAYYTSEQGKNMKDGQTSPKTESLTSVSTEESTTQMKSVEHLFTTLPLVHQSKLSNTQVRPSPTPWPTTILQFMSSQGIQAANESPTPVIPRGGLALTWVIVPTLGLMGSLMLSFRLWRALRRKGSFIPKQL
ncbi:mucosal addressin cell adhesion molecule 1 isoform X1 [Xenopus laevis]|uniref:Mucosal addressin cell adhesion molecule 1 isoform X1 n=2 Tax=Xenopus laevis TaxID=8355 RepID=A0A1L8HNP1_XENLA|nr:mucosal addressin cell adhesion molecule 1 isoform X1 [Xenopus laevis]OCT97704.1 hypothetical protein XELAEV_18009933mg [Xenopus laevis]